MRIVLTGNPANAVLFLARAKLKAQDYVAASGLDSLASFKFEVADLKTLFNSQQFKEYLIDACGDTTIADILTRNGFTPIHLVGGKTFYAPPANPEDEKFFVLMRVDDASSEDTLTLRQLRNVAGGDLNEIYGGNVTMFFIYDLPDALGTELGFRKTKSQGIPCHTPMPERTAR